MQDYTLSGGYAYLQEEGTFSGALRVLDDNRIVGSMIDEGSDITFRKGKNKFILGAKRLDEIVFWKFTRDQFTVPLIYIVKEHQPNNYIGKWAPIPVYVAQISNGLWKQKGMPEVVDALNSDSLQVGLEILSRIEKDRIDSYLPQQILSQISQTGCYGYMHLNPVDSFGA